MLGTEVLVFRCLAAKVLNSHGQHGLFLFLSSLPISVLCNLE